MIDISEVPKTEAPDEALGILCGPGGSFCLGGSLRLLLLVTLFDFVLLMNPSFWRSFFSGSFRLVVFQNKRNPLKVLHV